MGKWMSSEKIQASAQQLGYQGRQTWILFVQDEHRWWSVRALFVELRQSHTANRQSDDCVFRLLSDALAARGLEQFAEHQLLASIFVCAIPARDHPRRAKINGLHVRFPDLADLKTQ